MKIKVGLSADEIEIGQYREVNKGALKAYFSLLIYPYGQKILDCTYFERGDQRWFNFPQKAIKQGDKTEYIPLISYLNKDYLNYLKFAIMTALSDIQQQGTNAKPKVQPHQRQENILQAEPSFDYGDMPF